MKTSETTFVRQDGSLTTILGAAFKRTTEVNIVKPRCRQVHIEQLILEMERKAIQNQDLLDIAGIYFELK